MIHATQSLEATLTNIKSLMSNNGILAFVEPIRKTIWLDFVFGFLPGWWLFKDNDVRKNHPLISTDQWKMLLEKVGFSDISAIPEDELGYVPVHAVITVITSYSIHYTKLYDLNGSSRGLRF